METEKFELRSWESLPYCTVQWCTTCGPPNDALWTAENFHESQSINFNIQKLMGIYDLVESQQFQANLYSQIVRTWNLTEVSPAWERHN